MIERNLNKKIYNDGRLATWAEIYSINKENRTILCDLLDDYNNMIEEARLFTYEGEFADIPFTKLMDSEIELLNKKK